MTARQLLILLVCASTLTACGMMPGGDSDPEAAGSTAPAEPAEPVSSNRFPELTVGTSTPDTFSRQLGRYTTYARTDCNNDRDQRAAFVETLDKLKGNAVEDGADYLRVLGTGELESRGLCHNDMFQLTGVAFREETLPQGGSAGGGSNTDSLTSRLEELDTLRDRGLISDNEYQQLRERVLNEAY